MSEIFFVIPCGAEKLGQPAPARELYSSINFQRTLAKVEQEAKLSGARVLILSAKLGLVELARQGVNA